MMTRAIYRGCLRATFAVLVAIATAMPCPAQGPIDGAEVTSATGEQLSYAEQRRSDYLFHEALRYHHKEQFDVAFELLCRCIEVNPYVAQAYFIRASYYSATPNDSALKRDLLRAAALDPANDFYQERLAAMYIKEGDIESAIAAYEELFAHNRDRSDVLALLVQLYRQNRDFEGEIGAIERIEQIEGADDELSYQKMRAYERLGNDTMAYGALLSLVEANPYEASYKTKLGNWLVGKGRNDEAYRMLIAAKDDDPKSEEVLYSLYDYYRAVGNDSLADATRDGLLLSPATTSETKISFLRQLFRSSMQTDTLKPVLLPLLDKMVEAAPKDVETRYFRVMYMELMEFDRDTIDAEVLRILEISPERTDVRRALVQSYLQQGRWDEMGEQAEVATQYEPDAILMYYLAAFAHYRNDDTDGALRVLRNGVAAIKDDSYAAEAAAVYSFLGDVLYGMGQADEAFEAYETAVGYNPDDISCLNNYAYYLSVQDERLDDAERMSRRTIEEEPDNATYLDTYAWILFKKGDYEGARMYIDRALSALETTADTLATADDSTATDLSAEASEEMLEHAGDIYYMCGEASIALDYWQRALLAGGDGKALRRKIKTKKYVK